MLSTVANKMLLGLYIGILRVPSNGSSYPFEMALRYRLERVEDPDVDFIRFPAKYDNTD